MSQVRVPTRVSDALRRATEAGFDMSSEPAVGQLLAVLAGAVRPGGRILELGTGVGAGLAWIVDGLSGRTDVEVVSVELNPATAAVAASGDWPAFVHLRVGDVLALLPDLGRFDLVFADAQGGKWEGLDRTIATLNPGGLLLVDDMTPPRWASPAHEENNRRVRERLLDHPDLYSVEMHWSSGLILCSRRP